MKLQLFWFMLLALAVYANDKVVYLTAEDFKNGKVEDSAEKIVGRWFIKFFVPWCPHCKKLAPEWIEMSNKVTDQVRVGEFNCTADVDFCIDHGIDGFPTILYGEEGVGWVEYGGPHKAADLLKYIEEEQYRKKNVKDQVVQTQKDL